MSMITVDDGVKVYKCLKDRQGLLLTTAFALNAGFTVDCPIIVGKEDYWMQRFWTEVRYEMHEICKMLNDGISISSGCRACVGDSIYIWNAALERSDIA